jgi:8-amino-7-oxononanoate synthase
VLSALLGPRDTAYCDALIHASLAEGCRVAHATLRFYRHADPDHLESLIRQAPARGRRLIVTDGVFSMEGDFAPLPALVTIANRYDAVLAVDDAHGAGTVGPGGRGTAARYGVSGDVPVQIGTLSKAFGSQGGYVAGRKELIDLVVHRGKAFLHSTAGSPVLAAGALEALRISQARPQLREQLIANIQRLHIGLRAKGLHVLGDQESPVAGIVLGEAEAAIRQADRLREAGVFAPAIRPPTIPKGTSRIRLAPMASHSLADMDRVVEACG